MNQENIKAEKITKPIQLLGAWLVGLLSISSSFLVAATNMPSNSWESSALVIAAILNVPIFLGAVFLLQTKFRPELQEDSYYSTYLSQKTNKPITINKRETHFYELEKKLEHIELKLEKSISQKSNDFTIKENFFISINKNLDDYEKIKEKLISEGILRISNFGLNNKKPSQGVVAISEYLSKEETNEAIKLVKDLGFKHYSFFNNQAEETREDILVGAYGGAEFDIP